uniref:Beta-glucosidase n=1 Tax=uncultured bacterium Contig178 TaxID=1393517 RepID=W0FP77_9BACT|nr:beta-glucosidase [uncultured bacterium Contig178]
MGSEEMCMRLNWKEYEDLARQTIGEGIVLLKNDGPVLPLSEDSRLAVFGRMQNNYYKSGTGSGGMVNVPVVHSIIDVLKAEGISLNEELLSIYEEFEKEHPFDPGIGFGNEPWSQEEMEVSAELVEAARTQSDTALVIIGRTAGEEQDYIDDRGAYRLAEKEADLLRKVRAAFDRVVLIMNVSAILDMQEIEEISPDAILYVWQGGEIGAAGCVDVLFGRVNPSGRLTDSIVRRIEDASAYGCFGDRVRNFYAEDIYVGYRYYETFHKAAVMYPFGFGLSYTDYVVTPGELRIESEKGDRREEILDISDKMILSANVKNTGKTAGKEVVQFYGSMPQGKLGKPALSLVGFAKTDMLQPGEDCTVSVEVTPYSLSSYDETGITGYGSSYVLEAGEYIFHAGENVRNVKRIGGFTESGTLLVEKLSRQMAPSDGFDRIRPVERNGVYEIEMEPVPTAPLTDSEEAAADRPEALPYTGDQGIKLKDVRDGRAKMEDFLAQLSDEDLAVIIRAEGMGSQKVTPGTAAAFGGMSAFLRDLGIPAGCCSDGPSGLRLDSGARAFSLPNGTLLACTWNPELVAKLYSMLGLEMNKNDVDLLLGPGINIHRYPLNGRNFEYFSEDPLVTGRMAAAVIRGLKQSGASGTLKHFCANNQETCRHTEENVVSERALREIYLKGFEIAVKEAGADSVMTTYGPVNGIWTSSRHDLNTNILRKEWGFRGIVMTDWWANIGDVGGQVDKTSFSRIVLAQNDLYAVCPDSASSSLGDDTLAALESGRITRGQLVRAAGNICGVLMHTNAMKRLCGEPYKVEVTNYTSEEEETEAGEFRYYEIQDGTEIDLTDVNTGKGESVLFSFAVPVLGPYWMDMVGSSDLSELSQMPVGIFYNGVPKGTFTFHGGGEELTIRREIRLDSTSGIMRMKFMNGGLKLKKVVFIRI